MKHTRCFVPCHMDFLDGRTHWKIVYVTWTKHLVCFNLVSEGYIHSYIMNPETSNIHAFNKTLVVPSHSRNFPKQLHPFINPHYRSARDPSQCHHGAGWRRLGSRPEPGIEPTAHAGVRQLRPPPSGAGAHALHPPLPGPPSPPPACRRWAPGGLPTPRRPHRTPTGMEACSLVFSGHLLFEIAWLLKGQCLLSKKRPMVKHSYSNNLYSW